MVVPIKLIPGAWAVRGHRGRGKFWQRCIWFGSWLIPLPQTLSAFLRWQTAWSAAAS